MTIELRTFASGDTDYISKMNANVEALKAAIDALQSQAAGAGGVNEITVGMFWESLFSGADCLLGPGSYKPTQHASTVTVAPGTMYLADQQTVISLFSETTLNFQGQTSGTYYIVAGSTGVPILSGTMSAGTVYSVQWTGGGFIGEPVRIALCLFDAAEATASRESEALGAGLSPPEGTQIYATLDERLEATEELAVQAASDAQVALEVAYEGVPGGGSGIRKVGISLDGSGVPLTTGIKGLVQLDYDGVILGWSAVADKVGGITVDVCVKHSADPPNAPAIPNTTTDKISASAPIRIASAQSAAGDETSVSTWVQHTPGQHIDKWDVLLFNVTFVAVVTRVTLYLRIQEV
jgi:hypothetical protein